MIHLLKVAAGIRNTEQMRMGIAECFRGQTAKIITANMPKRADELMDGGSIFWIIGRKILVRQRILDVSQHARVDGKKVCVISTDANVVDVMPTGKNGFQGWRYLSEEEAPHDLPPIGETGELPQHMIEELRKIGLL